MCVKIGIFQPVRKNKENEDGDLLNVFWNEPRKGRGVGLEKHFATKAGSKAEAES